ncbi:MAG: hypothetical protein JJU11_04950 [Candidatus Sumerlaeia bacterium]|nr:hypothetical protein [Candidatus Sumerlaeia bacterium]
MILVLAVAIVISFLMVILVEVASNFLFPACKNGRHPRPSVGVGMVVSLVLLWLLDPPMSAVAEGPRAELVWAIAGALLMLVVGLRSDYSRPRSRNHFLGTMAAAVLCFLGGFSFTLFQIPLVGIIDPGFLLAGLLTLLLVFLVVSMVELCSLLPLAAGAVTFLIGAMVLLPLGSWETQAGFILCGVLMGSALGRVAGKTLMVRSDPHEKADILVMGYVAACAVLATFLKSVTVAAFILPLGFLAALFVLVGLQSFDRLTLLREKPRG